MPERAKDLISC